MKFVKAGFQPNEKIGIWWRYFYTDVVDGGSERAGFELLVPGSMFLVSGFGFCYPFLSLNPSSRFTSLVTSSRPLSLFTSLVPTSRPSSPFIVPCPSFPVSSPFTPVPSLLHAPRPFFSRPLSSPCIAKKTSLIARVFIFPRD